MIEPTPYQLRCLAVPLSYNLIAGGGRGGGKSFYVALEVLRHVESYGAAANVLIVRENYKPLAELEDLIESLGIDAYGSVNRNRADHLIRFANGATVEFGQLDSSTAYKKYQGRSYTLLVIEEFGALKEVRHVQLLASNLRSSEDIPLRQIWTCNPGGLQHAYLHTKFIANAIPWEPFEVDGQTFVYAPATLLDNPHLDQSDYEAKLRMACDNNEALLASWLRGDWAAGLGGAFFADVWAPEKQRFTTFPFPLRGKDRWQTAISLDFGTAAPAVCQIGAKVPRGGATIDGIRMPAGSICVVDEYAAWDERSQNPNKGLNLPASVLANRITALCERWGVHPAGVGDDAAGIEESLLKFLRGYKIYLNKPEKQRATGWARVRQMLFNSKEGNGLPGLYLSARCKYTNLTMPTLPRDEYDLSDLDSSSPDHGADTLRYLLMHMTKPGIRYGRVAAW